MLSTYWFWLSFIFGGTIYTANAAYLRCYNGSLNNYIVASLEDPLPILRCLLDKSSNITIYTFGFKGKVDGPATTTVLTAYIQLNTSYLLLLDWEKEAATEFTDLEYAEVTERVKTVAKDHATALLILIKNGIKASNIHLIGHSLGAHLMGLTGKNIMIDTNNGTKINRITGLDPAGPLYDDKNGLTHDQGIIVVVVHTNPGEYGTIYSLGKIDFWVNCNNNYTQPGCPFGPEVLTNTDARLCSHNRSWMVYAIAVLSPKSFPALRASSCSAWTCQSNSSTEINYLGDDVDPTKVGNFYLSTTSKSPFSKEKSGLKPNDGAKCSSLTNLLRK